MRSRAWGLAVAAIAVAALAIPASAHTQRFPSGVTIHHPNKPTYRGRVFSDLTKCQRRRTVELRTADGDDVITTTKTNREGRWQIDFSGTEYYAKVKRMVIQTEHHRHVCLPDVSRTI